MSGEIKYNFSVKYANGKLKNSTDSGNVCIDQAEAKMISTVQTIGFLEHEALCLCDLSSVGVSTLCNLDNTNSVNIGTVAPASGTITIDDYSVLLLDTVTISGTPLLEGDGNDWIIGFDNDSTAANLATAINSNEPTVIASVVSNVITIRAVAVGVVGNSITMAYTDSGSEIGLTLSGATLTGGSDTFIPFIKLKPLETYIVRLGTMNLYALAETADVDLQFTIYAD